MVKKLVNLWDSFSVWVGDKLHKPKTLNEVMAEEDDCDALEIKQTTRTIVSQQYLLHMAEARIKARQDWRQKQEAALETKLCFMSHLRPSAKDGQHSDPYRVGSKIQGKSLLTEAQSIST